MFVCKSRHIALKVLCFNVKFFIQMNVDLWRFNFVSFLWESMKENFGIFELKCRNL